jgi:hypothetical protein
MQNFPKNLSNNATNRDQCPTASIIYLFLLGLTRPKSPVDFCSYRCFGQTPVLFKSAGGALAAQCHAATVAVSHTACLMMQSHHSKGQGLDEVHDLVNTYRSRGRTTRRTRSCEAESESGRRRRTRPTLFTEHCRARGLP